MQGGSSPGLGPAPPPPGPPPSGGAGAGKLGDSELGASLAHRGLHLHGPRPSFQPPPPTQGRDLPVTSRAGQTLIPGAARDIRDPHHRGGVLASPSTHKRKLIVHTRRGGAASPPALRIPSRRGKPGEAAEQRSTLRTAGAEGAVCAEPEVKTESPRRRSGPEMRKWQKSREIKADTRARARLRLLSLFPRPRGFLLPAHSDGSAN